MSIKVSEKFFKNKCFDIRKTILHLARQSGGKGAHLGGTMSCVEILAFLYYCNILKFDNKNALWENRDRFLIGKGHAHLALYSIWSDLGFFKKSLLKTYGKNGTKLGVQLDTNIPGSEYNTGSLGHVIGIANGISVSSKLDKKKINIYCLIGDGECESGSIWESVLNTTKMDLNNIIVIVDVNRLSEMQDLGNYNSKILRKKFQSYDWEVFDCNGHNFTDLKKTFLKIQKCKNKPKVIIANTIKGKGVSFMENNVEWHHKAPNDKEFIQALKEYL
jgi:transketolase